MKKIQRFKFVLISLICVILIFHFHEPDARYLETVSEMLGIVVGEPINASFPITFYQSAYVDYRFTPPRLRIFTLNPCIKNYQFLSADLHLNGNNFAPVRRNIYGTHLDDDCPSALIKKVTIHLGSRKVELNVQKVYKKSTEGITVCLQPVYYYSQWQNIVLYIEAWRAQGATRFIVYFHSATKETWRTLEYYRNLGMIELKSWPSFPSLPVDIADKYPKIDDSIFILSYFLAMNICILDIKTTIGTIADFDEVMVPTNGRLLDYATEEMTGTKVGALSFENHYVLFTPKIYTSHFSGVASPKFKILTWPSKADGALLHFRYNAEAQKPATTEMPFRFFPDNHSTHIKNMEATAHKIFNGVIPKFSSKSYDALQECVNKIMKVEDKVCRSTSGLCKTEMDKVNDWVYDRTEPIFLIGT